jgi:hypothetical protein
VSSNASREKSTHSQGTDLFPTRQYSHRLSRRESLVESVPAILTPGVYRFRLGRDVTPQGLSIDDLSNGLHDPFARLVLLSGKLPATLRELLRTLDATNAQADGLPQQQNFIVSDGGQIPWNADTQTVARQFRFVIARAKATQIPDLFMSTSREIDSTSTFLQVVGWDPVNGAFQFYDRRDGAWFWAGNSWDALEADTRSRGPFDSHVNGALNMKELKLPWINWHSEAATIDGALAPDDPLRSEPLWQGRSGANQLEPIIKDNIRRWTNSRFERRTAEGKLTRLSELLGQILTTTTINVIASPDETSQLRAGKPLHLPLPFFINSDMLFNILELSPDIAQPTIDGGIYLDCLKQFDVALTDGEHRFPGDTHFPFAVPEVAFEDVEVLRRLIDSSIITKKLAACLLMVDFYNPVFSQRRAALIRYIPESTAIQSAEAFSTKFAQAVEAAAGRVSGSPEQEFVSNWRLADNEWQSSFESRIKNFFDQLKLKLGGLDGFIDIFKVAESRRREFRKRPLAEFRLTTPITNIPENSPLLEFLPDASVHVKS